MEYIIEHKEEYDAIQIAAEKVQDQYNKVLKENPGLDPIFSEPMLNKLTEELVKLIVKFPSKEFNGNESMYRAFVYITKTIPNYSRVDENGKKQYYFSMFRMYYDNDYEKIRLTEASVSEDWNKYGRNEFNRIENDLACEKIQVVMKILEDKGIKLDEESDHTFDQLVDIVYNEKYNDKHKDDFVEKHRKEIKHYLEIIYRYGFVKLYNPNDVSAYGEVSEKDLGIDEQDLSSLVDKDSTETIGFFRLLARFSSNYISKRNRDRIHCLFTNDVAPGFRDYVSEGVDDFENPEDQKQYKMTRALSLEDSFEGCRDEIYEGLLHIGYLRSILQDNTPNSLERISGVCLDECQNQDGKPKKFIAENIAKYLGVDKGTISALRNGAYFGLKNELMEWYGLKK